MSRYVIRPCREADHDLDGFACVDVCAPREAQFWTVYERIPATIWRGGSGTRHHEEHALQDFPTRAEAEDYLRHRLSNTSNAS